MFVHALFLNFILGFEEALSGNEERRENSEDDGWKRIGSLKKKALSASSKLRHSFKKKGSRKNASLSTSHSIEDIRDVKEVQAVEAFRQALMSDNLLPPMHDDYHMLLRLQTLITSYIDLSISMEGGNYMLSLRIFIMIYE